MGKIDRGNLEKITFGYPFHLAFALNGSNAQFKSHRQIVSKIVNTNTSQYYSLMKESMSETLAEWKGNNLMEFN